jgi:hypothetical protein
LVLDFSTIPPLAPQQQGGLGVSLIRSPHSLARVVASSRATPAAAAAATTMMNGRGSRGGGAGGAAAATPNASASASAAAAGNPADLAGSAPDDNDWSTYFCTYAYLYHQVRWDRN